MHTQLSDYLEKRGILFDNQSGFRSGHSTDSCLLELSDFVKDEIGKGNLVGMVLIDLQKAFDTVAHDVLIEKLSAIGIDSVLWFKSYLSNRHQCVDVNGSRSEFLPISCGVPQESILGPLLFLIYINDMHMSLTCNLSLYADDSALVFSHKDASAISQRLSFELSSCKQWLVDNKLSLHIGKTECLLFGSKCRLKKVNEFTVTCEGKAVRRVETAKYLGVHLDASFTGSLHVTNMLKVCAGRLAFLYRNSSLLDFQTRKTLCTALIQPYLDYCCSSWYEGITAELKTRLDTFQRKMIRFIFGFENRRHVGHLELKSLQWFSVPDRVRFFKLVHTFKIRNGLSPNYLRSRFTSVSDTHTHKTRGSNVNFRVSRSLSLAPTSFAFTSVRLWNELPNRIKEIDSLLVFIRELRKYLLNEVEIF